MREEISSIFKEWKKESGVENIILLGVFPNVKKVIKVYTNEPEIMKGKDGCLLKKYVPLLKECIPDLISIEISKAY